MERESILYAWKQKKIMKENPKKRKYINVILRPNVSENKYS